MNPMSELHDVGNLKKFTKYEFFIAPFYRSVEGQPSNSKIVQTLEDGELQYCAKCCCSFKNLFILCTKQKKIQFPQLLQRMYKLVC